MRYTWRCVSCSHETEVQALVKDRDISPGQCPKCKGTMLRILFPNPFVLRGEGWAKDNYTKSQKNNGGSNE